MNSVFVSAYTNKNISEFENLLASGKFNPDAIGFGTNQNLSLLLHICDSICNQNNTTDIHTNLIFVEILLKYGANPNAPTAFQILRVRSPIVAILFALQYGPHILPFFKLLLDYGADPHFPKNIINEIAYTDIDVYCVEALKMALQAGAKKNIPINHLGHLPIDALRTRVANPAAYIVKNIHVLHLMIQVLENHMDNIPVNLHNVRRNAATQNALIYKQSFAQNLQQIEHQKREEERIKLEQLRQEQMRQQAERNRLEQLRQQAERNRLEQLRQQVEQNRLEQLRQEEERNRLEQLRQEEERNRLEQLRQEEERNRLEQLRQEEEQKRLEQLRQEEERNRLEQLRQEELQNQDYSHKYAESQHLLEKERIEKYNLIIHMNEMMQKMCELAGVVGQLQNKCSQYEKNDSDQ